ncbi:ABC transporter substrate-binding protein [Halovenus aranensis]|uniref:ABC transporter substrate-binding protein n=1 Tax=Halovenus aranensis TaxID=890420 RepID=UPI000AA0C26D|nr:ABC transporter substrate-binding protein [Halovenus aranensis]
MDFDKLSRRRVLGALGASGTIALAGCSGGDGDDGSDGEDGSDGSDGSDGEDGSDGSDGSDGGDSTNQDLSGTLRIGVLQDFSGQLAVYGAQGSAGFYSGLAHKAGNDPLPADAIDEGDYSYAVNDIDIEIRARDTQFAPTQAQTLASELVTQDDVDMLYGVGNSGGAISVINGVVDQAEVPFIAGPAASAEITAGEGTCRDLVFRANENTAMDARSGGVYIADQTDVDQIALFGADDAFGQSVVNNYRTVLENRGVTIADERAVPEDLDQPEWVGLLDEAESAGAEGIVGGFTAAGLSGFFSAFLDGDYDFQLFGGFASRLTLGVVGNALQSTLDDFSNEALQAADFGPFTTRYHWNQYDNPINDQFVESHAGTYGVVPDLFTSGAFTAASAVVQAMNEQGEVSADAIVEGMSGMTVTDTPKGENGYTFQEYNNQARSEMTVAPVTVTPDSQENWPAAIMPGDPIERVSADEVTIPASEMSCDLS